MRVVIAEDLALLREGLVALLRTVPDFSIVAEASDGRKAIELFRLHQPDVTLMDLRLPQMNGVEAIGRIRSGATRAGGAIAEFEGYTGAEDTERKILRNVFENGDAWYRTGDLVTAGDDGTCILDLH